MATTKIENSAIQLASAANVRNIWGGIIINVKAYGAIGDGVTNDTAAIQAALNAGGLIIIPEGTYLYTPPLRITQDGTRLVGINRELSILKPTATSANALEVGVTANVNNVTIENITVQGNVSNNHGVVFGSVAYYAIWVQLENVLVQGFTKVNSDGVQINNSWWFNCSRSLINGCYNNIHIPDNAVTTTILIDKNTAIERADNVGVLIDGSSAINGAVTFNNVSFEYCTIHALRVTSKATRINLDTCYFEQNSNVIHISGGSGTYEYNVLNMKNCNTDTPLTGYAIYLDYVQKSNIVDCFRFINGPITTTANTDVYFENMNALSAGDFLAVARTLLGHIRAKEVEPSTGKVVNYDSIGTYFDGHIGSVQGTLPTIAAGVATGSGGAAALSAASTDTAGQVQATFGASGWLADKMCRVTFNKTYNRPPTVMLTPGSTKAAQQQMNCGVSVDTTVSYFDVYMAAAETSSGLAYWNYLVIE